MLEHFEDGFALRGEYGVFVAFALSAPVADRLRAFVDVVRTDGDVLVRMLFFERVDVVLLAVVFAPLELGEVLAQVDVVEVVAVALDACGRVCLTHHISNAFFNAAHDERLFFVFEICDPVVHDCQDSFVCAERLDGVFFAVPGCLDEQAIFIFCPFDVVCFAPHEQVGKGKVCVLAVLRAEVGCDPFAISERDRLKLYFHRSVLLGDRSALCYGVRLVRILRADLLYDTKSAAHCRRRFCASYYKK